jgi:hypothetical protein
MMEKLTVQEVAEAAKRLPDPYKVLGTRYRVFVPLPMDFKAGYFQGSDPVAVDVKFAEFCIGAVFDWRRNMYLKYWVPTEETLARCKEEDYDSQAT